MPADSFKDRVNAVVFTASVDSLKSILHKQLPNVRVFLMPVPYDKIIADNGTQKTVKGFICKKNNDKKGFKVGDMLKAATYSAPATNFSRGNIFDENVRVGHLGIM